ncbi:hypothetical protein IJG22_03225 [Candidatus Saccharibacteria bacterium]|nr:hypothetical protein [Candidatus Saccharibacteria bacterium]
MNKQNLKSSLRASILEATYRKKIYAGLAFVTALSAWALSSSLATLSANDSSAITCIAGECDIPFQVNVQDIIAVEVTTQDVGTTGNINEFLRNTVDIEINSNVSNGFTATMYSRNNTNLTHTILGSEYNIPTMSNSSARSSFPTNTWGYSLKSASLDGKTYGETDLGNDSSNYYPLTTSTSTPIKVLEAASGTKTGTQSIYFGTKVNAEKPSGTYSNTVVISVVTGTIENDPNNPDYNPITPTDPVTPGTDSNPNDGTAVYTGENTHGTGISGTRGTTVYTSRNSHSYNDTTTTTTEVSAGDHTGSYAPAQGVSVTTQTNIVEGGSMLPIGLAATSIATATAGVIFFVLAKRDEDDEDEEEDLI